jgi:adenylate kinase
MIESRHARTVLVAGVPGVGKTALLSEHVAGRPADVCVLGSSIVKRVIAPLTVHDLDRMPAEARERIRVEAVRQLEHFRLDCAGHLLVDGHLTLRNRASGEVEACFTESDRRFFDALVLVDATPEFVATLRERDRRSRGVESVEAIADHLEKERGFAQELARCSRWPYHVVGEAGVIQRCQSLREFLDSVTQGGVS